MKCPYVSIIFFAFALQVANAAPTYSIGAILDELLEINIRMSDVILRAKYEYGQVQANELKDTLGKIVIHKSPLTNSYEWVNDAKQRIDSIKAFATSDGRDVTDSTPKNVRSLFGRTFDAIGNQWNNWFNKRKIMDINENGFNGNGLIEDDDNNNVLIEPCDVLIDDQNVNGDIFLKESIDSTDTVFTINNNLCDIDSDNAEIYFENQDFVNQDTNNIDVGTADSDKVNSVSTDLVNIEPDNTISGNAFPVNLDSNNSRNTASENTTSSSVDTYNTVTGNPYSENTNLGNVDETTNSSNLESNDTAAGNLDSENTDSGNSGSDNQTEEQTTDNELTTGNEKTTGNAQATDNEQSGDQEAKADNEHEQNWGEETSNDESNDVGWFESAIDSIVNFFS
ncbi:putative uncharacterized protein DDB_G0282133 isoform X2 [Bradysia coprophila]|uniref:putative uncharacterized protein DDB_G0282133 isoform X2 n=1 Tax=Bradysia coprophila TaxID=38358 RepID=UPI00187DD422|nr:putative uncharacterized protein DDB_G0282133 isoform X2 [Bradysia coprophila]